MRRADSYPESACEVVASKRKRTMLGWIVTFLVVALIAAALGFGGIAGTAVGLAKLVFYVFLVLFLMSLVYSLATGRSPPAP